MTLYNVVQQSSHTQELSLLLVSPPVLHKRLEDCVTYAASLFVHWLKRLFLSTLHLSLQRRKSKNTSNILENSEGMCAVQPNIC